jgi:hypothetical protein
MPAWASVVFLEMRDPVHTIVQKRTPRDIKAYIKGKRGGMRSGSASGETIAEAVGNLIMWYRNVYGIEIVIDDESFERFGGRHERPGIEGVIPQAPSSRSAPPRQSVASLSAHSLLASRSSPASARPAGFSIPPRAR